MYGYVEVESHRIGAREREHAAWVLRRTVAVSAMDAAPRVRWFRMDTRDRELERRVIQPQSRNPGWLTFQDVRALRGITFAGNPHEIWVRAGQSLEDLAETIEHEALHCLQLQIYGARAVVGDKREECEAAALRYGKYAREVHTLRLERINRRAR